MAEAEAFARGAGSRAMDLRVISPRAAQLLPFYLRLGYERSGNATDSRGAGEQGADTLRYDVQSAGLIAAEDRVDGIIF